MTNAGMRSCAGCEAAMRVIDELRANNVALQADIATLRAKVASLEKNSSNSSKPPSSDFIKKPKPKPKRGKRKRGGQPGHQQHKRDPFDDADVHYDEIYCTECPDCHGPLV